MNLGHAEHFIERIADMDSAMEIGEAFAELLKPFDFLAVSAGHSRETPSGRVWEFFFNTWRREWLIEYQREDYVRHDPMPHQARLSAEPFTWRDILETYERTDKRRQFEAWAEHLGLRDGFATPVHYPGGDLSLCVAVAARPIVSAAEKRALHLASIYAIRRCREIGGPEFASASTTRIFSPREMECMRWVLEGKSDTDIGDILGISPTTAHFHIERVKKKFGVRTRVQAARLMVSLGYL